MSTKSKTLAKSLHTVTALAAVARLHARYQINCTPADAIAAALETFGYTGAADPYGLADKARAILEKGFDL
jgi:hypothetical protein